MKQKNIKLNLGCGSTLTEGWINVDNSPNALLAKFPGYKFLKWILYKLRIISTNAYQANWDKNIVHCNLMKRFPKIGSNNCTVIYSSHFIEHIPYEKTVALLKHCYSGLDSGGILRIAVPDLYTEAKDYVKRIEEALKKGLEDDTAGKDFIHHMISRQKRHAHLFMYDLFSLTAILREIGFINIEKKKFLESSIQEIELVEKREDSLFIECRKL